MAKSKKAVQTAPTDPLRITHAVLVDETCTYSYSVRLENGETDTITNECGRQYHNDLKEAFKAFDGHLAVITEQVDPEEVSDIETCEGSDDKITGKLLQLQTNEVKIAGNLETGSIIVSGVKVLKTNDEIRIKTPKTAFDSDYDFIQELVSAATHLINEITEYHNGKSRPDLQLKLDLDKHDDENK